MLKSLFVKAIIKDALKVLGLSLEDFVVGKINASSIKTPRFSQYYNNLKPENRVILENGVDALLRDILSALKITND